MTIRVYLYHSRLTTKHLLVFSSDHANFIAQNVLSEISFCKSLMKSVFDMKGGMCVCARMHTHLHTDGTKVYACNMSQMEATKDKMEAVMTTLPSAPQGRERVGAGHSARLHHHLVLHGSWGGGRGRGLHVPPPGHGSLQALLRPAPLALQGRQAGGGHHQHRHLQL